MTRIYKIVPEALSEISRDLAEMGIRVHPKTYQDKVVENNSDFETLELQNYIYTILKPDSDHLKNLISQPYCDVEWEDRESGITGTPLNPGYSWLERKGVWEEFLEEGGTFAYTYPERFSRHKQVQKVIERLRVDPDSRQCFISVWAQDDITKMGGLSRIPCTLGYLAQIRGGRLDLTYLQRSCDFATHMKNDIFFAIKLQEYIAERVGVPVGRYTHWLGSLHVFQKDVKDVF